MVWIYLLRVIRL